MPAESGTFPTGGVIEAIDLARSSSDSQTQVSTFDPLWGLQDRGTGVVGGTFTRFKRVPVLMILIPTTPHRRRDFRLESRIQMELQD